MNTTKTALLFADRKGDELAPLSEHFAPATLPIAGKCALEFWFEYLCEQKIETVYLFVASHSAEIKQQFPTGEHWGLNLHYLLSRGEEKPSDLVARYASELPTQFSAARADRVPKPMQLGDQLTDYLDIDLEKPESGELLDTLSWQHITQKTRCVHNLATLQDYANIITQVLNSEIAYCTPRGLMLDDRKWTATPEFSHNRIDSIDGSLYVGRDSVVERSVIIQDGAVIESGCFIDQGARLKNAVILPDTYIGQNVTLDNCIAHASLMIDLKHGIAQQIEDPALLSPIKTSARVTRTTNRERFVAALLMLLSAWFALPVALLFKRRGEKLMTPTTRRSNRGSRKYPLSFECLGFNTPWRSLNNWPRLIHVIDGDLKLFGTEIEGFDREPALAELPLSQGIFTPKNMHPKHPFDEIELQLWGLELANANSGFFKLLVQSIRAMSNSLFRRSASV